MTKTTAPTGELDSEELLFLALQAMQQDRDEDAISLLKRGLVLEPKSGVLHHLLGAVYAQLGMIDRAIGEMTEAITVQPDMHMARFQLGLLYFTSVDMDAATEVWQPLAELPADDPLYLFRSGLMHLGNDEFEDCIEDLERGIELNAEHPSLNNDMQLLVDRASEVVAAGGKVPRADPAPVAPAAGPARHVLLSGYRGANGGDKSDN